MRILMVEDSVADRRLCRILLEESLGLHTEFQQAGTAEEGLRLCREFQPDCILLDYKLPDMSGIEFLARLGGAHPGSSPQWAVVMLTGLGSESVAAEAMKAGAQDYLIKDQITASSLMLSVERASEKVRLLAALQAERDRLEASVAEKEVLLKEVHHRVKNNLQVVASLLRLQANSLEDGRAAQALRESQQRVESMALIHEQLYQTKDVREVDMAAQIRRLAGNLAHSYAADERGIAWEVSMEPLILELDRAIPVGLIMNELISNALKHGFPPGRTGTLQVCGTKRGATLQLEVKDDGTGFPEGMDARAPASFGLQIVSILTRQIKGTFEVVKSSGTTCRLIIPGLGECHATQDHTGIHVVQDHAIEEQGGQGQWGQKYLQGSAGRR